MKHLASLLLLVSLVAGASAQPSTDVPITIDFPDFIFYINHVPSVLTTFTSQEPFKLTSVLGSSDTNAVWDFTVAKFTRDPASPETDSFMDITGAPLSSDTDLKQANEVVRGTSATTVPRYQYLRFANSDSSSNPNRLAYKLGIVDDHNGDVRKVMMWNPPFVEAQYPMSFQSSWSTTSTITGDTIEPGETRVITSVSRVDQWGTMILPNQYNPSGTPTSQRALRVKEVTIETGSFSGGISKSDTTVWYRYYTPSLVSALIKTDIRNIIRYARFTVNVIPASGVTESQMAQAFNVAISQNPASNEITHVSFTLANGGPARVELMDALGRNVIMLHNGPAAAGRNVVSVDPQRLSNGTYFVRVEAEGTSAMQRLVVAH
ncbi:MAG: T9SS type A sorting domain-containing protein [Bacteroidetes bacterium]|nr:T9SS type A sorting domain-containing protein [Bacteroidota bacterium]